MTHTTSSTPPDGEAPGATALAGRLFYLFMLLRRGDAQLRRTSRSGRGVLQGQGRVLRMLALHSPIAQKDLSYLLGVRSQSLGEILSKLEAEGLVRRTPNTDDRRTWVVEITDIGRQADSEQSQAVEGDPFSILSDDDRRQLAALLDRVIRHVEDQFPGGVDRRLQKMRTMVAAVADANPEWGSYRHGPTSPWRSWDGGSGADRRGGWDR